jgi:hypothetical protein
MDGSTTAFGAVIGKPSFRSRRRGGATRSRQVKPRSGGRLCDVRHEAASVDVAAGLIHEQTVSAQALQSAACFATHHIQAHLCRWLLRARDLAGTDTLNFTQEYLAKMLGGRRTSVTVVALPRQTAGLIKYARGKIQIVNAEALQYGACQCYETVKRHYARLLGPAK